MNFRRRKSENSKNHALSRAAPRKRETPEAAEDGPELRRVVIYQITDPVGRTKWTLRGEQEITLRNALFEGEVKFTYRVLPKMIEALQGMLAEEEARNNG